MGLPSLTPYAEPKYFLYLIIALLPIIIHFLMTGKRWHYYPAFLTIIFIYISFGGPNYQQGLALVSYVIFESFLTSLYYRYRQKHNHTNVFYLAVVLAILPLVLVKVVPFLTPHQSLFGFLGISYLTFKSVQVIMEIRDGLIKQYRCIDYLSFLLFFPTISSGPIDRYRHFVSERQKALTLEQYLNLLDQGIWKLFLGCLYKFVLGYYFGKVWLPPIGQAALQHGGVSLALVGYMYCYSLYLFFDFAGYSLFAIGTSNLLGYEVPANFNKPFLAGNIKEFWNRWHMSLSFWFRDYVYMRLMFLLLKKKVFKSRIIASNVGYFALFLLMGLWHGLTWYYIVYGLFHATLICLTDAWLRYKKKHLKNLPSHFATHALAVFLTFNVVCFSFLIFSGFLDQLLF